MACCELCDNQRRAGAVVDAGGISRGHYAAPRRNSAFSREAVQWWCPLADARRHARRLPPFPADTADWRLSGQNTVALSLSRPLLAAESESVLISAELIAATSYILRRFRHAVSAKSPLHESGFTKRQPMVVSNSSARR